MIHWSESPSFLGCFGHCAALPRSRMIFDGCDAERETWTASPKTSISNPNDDWINFGARKVESGSQFAPQMKWINSIRLDLPVRFLVCCSRAPGVLSDCRMCNPGLYFSCLNDF